MQEGPHLMLSTTTKIVATLALIAMPALAQAQDRPSRACMQEVRELCASGGSRDRSRIRACVQEKFSQLSDSCAAELRERMQQRQERQPQREGSAQTQSYQSNARVSRTVVFGEHQRQQVDIYEPEGAVDDLPLILFVHGGGWRMGDNAYVHAKPAYFTGRDYFFASTGYRLLPDHPVEEQAADIGAAVQALRGQASSIGFDANQIILMGHSAGAHLAALVASDPSYAGEAFDAIRGVVLLDGAGYDIAANMADASPRGFQLYNNVFGQEAARQAALSPVTHVGGRDAPNWLALYVEERENARVQAQMLVNGLVEAGANASALAIAGTDHGRMNRELGTEAGAAQTEAVDAFLAALVG